MDKVSTGIVGLDKLTDGGLPKGRCILICGGAGTGKTVLSTQFLVNGVTKYRERGVFVTFDERLDHLKECMLEFGWKLDELEMKGKLALIDLSSMVYLSAEEFSDAVHRGEVKAPEYTVDNVTKMIRTKVEELKAKRIVVDSVTALMIHTASQAARRRTMAHFFNFLLDTGCTSLITSEKSAARLVDELHLEEYMAQGVILLQSIVRDDELTRTVRIEKMRGVNHDTQPHPYRITEKGIAVFQDEKVL